MPQYIRAFVAVEAPPEIQARAAALIGRLRESPAKVNWAKAGQLHWTLKFLGDVKLLEAPQICTAVSQAVAGLEPFDVEALGVGAFPDIERPRTVWLGTGDGSEAMIALQGAVEAKLAEIGFRPEARRYRPHLTIGRVRGQHALADLSQRIQAEATFDGGLTTIYDVAVLSSELTREGPVYQPLGHAELKG